MLLIVDHIEQQRQLKCVLPSHRKRRWPIPMHHQRVLGLQSSSAGQRKAAHRYRARAKFISGEYPMGQ
tara:strand:- start:348 stop:551 length:204 start_codon:yes stop_codon:yes gene_type:complete